MKPIERTTLEKLLLDYIPFVGTIAMVISYVPQIWLTYTTQNVTGQSLSFWAILTFSLGTMVLQQVGMTRYKGVSSYMGLIFQSLNFILALTMLVGVIVFT